ncbi:MAG: glucose-1-phosphate thymidylyltransferase RfbA, partial [Bacteroidetes bacterium]|nr:glucose-1-phosphate thymidylyltransferase RfbA [Bacteroidota bacterium]
MKGIILAGGSGSRLYPITKIYSKQLTLIYDKPLIYYPLSILMLGGIREILIISNEETIPLYEKLFGDGSQIGLSIEYVVQAAPNGIAEAFILGEEFIGDKSVTLILGDNIFYGELSFFYKALERQKGATIFGYQVNDPERYGIVEFDESGKVVSIEEKPAKPKSHFAVPGLYIFDNKVVGISKNLTPSARGELEITDVNKQYMEMDVLHVETISRGVAWLDTGTHESLMEAGQFVQTIESRQGLKVACLEEIGWRNGWLSCDELLRLAEPLVKNAYGQYLIDLVK